MSDQPAPEQSDPIPDAPSAFVSYSRRDSAFVRELVGALTSRGLNVWLDEEDIPPSARWRDELTSAIEGAGAFVAVISPQAAASKECGRELEHALALGKRIVPVLQADAPEASPELASRQYVDMRHGVDDARLDQLVAAITTDLDWVKGHTQWLQAALRWEASGRDRALLLRGSDLRAAEGWLVGQGAESEPRPTAAQVTFIQASRRGSTRRLQVTIGAAAVAIVVALALAGWALWQRGVAQDQRDTAKAGSLAQQANALLPTDPAESLSLANRATALRPTPEAVTARDEALIESHQCRRIDLAAPATGVEFAADGSEVVTAGPGRAARVWDIASAEQRLELPTDAGEVRSADMSADGSRVVVVSGAGDMGLWDVAREPARRLGAAGALTPEPVAAAAFSRKGERLAVVGQDGAVAIARARDGALVARGSPPAASSAIGLAVSPRGDAVGVVTAAGETILWRLGRRTGRPVLHARRLAAGGASAGAIAFTRTGRRLASGFRNGRVVVWSVAGPESPTIIAGQGRAVFSLDAGPGETLAVAGQGGRARLVDAVGGAELQSLSGHTGLIARIRFSPDGSEVATASDDGTIRVFDARAGGTRVVLAGHHANVRDVAFSPDGQRVASVGFDGTARVWDTRSGASAAEVRGDGSSLLDVALDPRGTTAAFASFGGLVTLAPLDAPGQATQIGPFDRPVQRVAFLPHGEQLLMARHDGSVALYDATDLTEVWSSQLHSGVVYDVAPSGDGRLVATGGADGRAWVIDARTGAPVPGMPHGVAHPRGAVLSARVDPSGTRLLTAGDDDTARLWDVTTGAPIERPMRHERGLFEAAFSPDGRLVATAGTDGSATIWSAETTTPMHRLELHRAPVTTVSFGPAGRTLLTASQDGTAAVWDTATGRLRAQMGGHTAPILRAAFSADGTRVATASEDGTARIYDAEDGHRVDLLRGAGSALTGIAITADGTTVVTSSTDGFGRIYPLTAAAPLADGAGPTRCKEGTAP
jgi:WD40 repeat protein